MARSAPRLVLLSVLLVVLVAAGAPALLADDATYQNLLARARETLREAERRYLAGEGGAALPARRARLLLEQADRQRVRDPEVAYHAVHAAVFEQNRDAATLWLERYEARTAYGERDPKLHFLRALLRLYVDDRPDRALEHLARLRAVAPARYRDPAADLLEYAALLAEGGRRMATGRCEEALGLFQRAARRGQAMGDREKEIAARANAGLALAACERFDEAVTVFERLAAESPDAPLWPWYLATTLARQERYEDAVAPYRRVLALLEAGRVGPAWVGLLQQAHLRLGNTLRQLARQAEAPDRRRALLEEARAQLERYVALAPRAVAGHYWLGVLLYEDFGRPYAALEAFQRAHALDPVCDDALRYLVRIASQHPPPPVEDPERRGEAEARWRTQLQAWKDELEREAEGRAAQREARRRASPDGSDGCR